MFRKYRLQICTLIILIIIIFAKNGIQSNNFEFFEFNFKGMYPIQGIKLTCYYYTPIYLLTILIEQEKHRHMIVYYSDTDHYIQGIIHKVYYRNAIIISSIVAIIFSLNLIIFYNSSLWLHASIILNILFSTITISIYLSVLAIVMELLKMKFKPFPSFLLTAGLSSFLYIIGERNLSISNVLILSLEYDSIFGTVFLFIKALALGLIYLTLLHRLLSRIQSRKDIIC